MLIHNRGLHIDAWRPYEPDICLRQACCGEDLARWIAWCEAPAVLLVVKEEAETSPPSFEIAVIEDGVPGALTQTSVWHRSSWWQKAPHHHCLHLAGLSCNSR